MFQMLIFIGVFTGSNCFTGRFYASAHHTGTDDSLFLAGFLPAHEKNTGTGYDGQECGARPR